VNLDGAVWSEVGTAGLDRPALQVLSHHREFAVTAEDAVKAGMAPDTAWFEAEKDITFGGWRTVDRTGRPGYTFQIQGATHLSFMDVPFLPVRDDAPVTAMLSATDIDPERMWRIVGDLVFGVFRTTSRRRRVRSARPARPFLTGSDPRPSALTLPS
jgi:hypothetical protein